VKGAELDTAVAERLVLCLARGRPGDWEAICLDFDIAVQGESFEQVENLLMTSVRAYVEDAMKESPANRDRLLRRSVPKRVRLGYAFSAFWHALFARRYDKGGALEHSFEMPCRA
jgi:adenosyl cobinamide kinase/adenosyl cobinamide phosphate guanylyltransferase